MIFTASHEGDSWQSWRDAAVGQIRFRPDRERVARELDAHYEDHRLDLERIGFDHALAERRALAAMGDRAWTTELTLFDGTGTPVRVLKMPWHTY